MRYRITRADGATETVGGHSVSDALSRVVWGAQPERIVRVEEYEPKMVTRWRYEHDDGEGPFLSGVPPWRWPGREYVRCERVEVEDTE